MPNVTEPTGAANQVSLGENSLVVVDGLTFAVIRATIREAPNEIPTTTNESGGFTERTRGPRDFVMDYEMFWVPTLNPLANPPYLEPGNFISNVQVLPDETWAPNNFYNLPVAYVVMNTVNIQGDGVQTYSGTLKNDGIYYSPQRPT